MQPPPKRTVATSTLDWGTSQKPQVRFVSTACGCDQHAVADDAPIEQDRAVAVAVAVADQRARAELSPMNHGYVGDREPVADHEIAAGEDVERRVVLDVRFRPIRIGPTSLRSTAPYQMLLPGPIVTSPITVALGAIHAVTSTTGHDLRTRTTAWLLDTGCRTRAPGSAIQ